MGNLLTDIKDFRLDEFMANVDLTTPAKRILLEKFVNGLVDEMDRRLSAGYETPNLAVNMLLGPVAGAADVVGGFARQAAATFDASIISTAETTDWLLHRTGDLAQLAKTTVLNHGLPIAGIMSVNMLIDFIMHLQGHGNVSVDYHTLNALGANFVQTISNVPRIGAFYIVGDAAGHAMGAALSDRVDDVKIFKSERNNGIATALVGLAFSAIISIFGGRLADLMPTLAQFKDSLSSVYPTLATVPFLTNDPQFMKVLNEFNDPATLGTAVAAYIMGAVKGLAKSSHISKENGGRGAA